MNLAEELDNKYSRDAIEDINEDAEWSFHGRFQQAINEAIERCAAECEHYYPSEVALELYTRIRALKGVGPEGTNG